MSLENPSQAPIQSLQADYSTKDMVSVSPSWALAIVPLGRPVTYSRAQQRSLGTVNEGAYSRRTIPTIITDDCVSGNVSGSKSPSNPTKNLSVTLKPASGLNYLDSNVVLPGDWILSWNWNNDTDAQRVLDLIYKGQAANGVNDGLKFVGRVHSIRKNIVMNGAKKTVTYYLQAVGFSELDTAFFYDTALANTADVEKRLGQIMARIGLNFSEMCADAQAQAGSLKDNTAYLITKMIDLVLGASAQTSYVNDAAKNQIADIRQSDIQASVPTPRNIENLIPSPQVSNEAPYSYLVPKTVGMLLGFDPNMASKASELFGYADILQTIIGVQHYSSSGEVSDKKVLASDFFPELNYSQSKGSRWVTATDLKGTFLPTETAFVNRPLWQMITQYNNRAINEMYTALKFTPKGILPTVVVRQIPFSSESIVADPDFPLTTFLNLPRWELPASLIYSLDVGRSDTTHTNLVHVYGNADDFEHNQSMTAQMGRNPPIFDDVDIARSGLRADMDIINCALYDQIEPPGQWMRAIADWKFGSQYTLNGSVQCLGIQSPIAEGDNLQIEDIVYHIEEVSHQWGISPDGHKHFSTSLSLSNGMPKDQSGATSDFPRYAGFSNVTNNGVQRTRNTSQVSQEDYIEQTGTSPISYVQVHRGDLINVPVTETADETGTIGDPMAVTSLDPGITGES